MSAMHIGAEPAYYIVPAVFACFWVVCAVCIARAILLGDRILAIVHQRHRPDWEEAGSPWGTWWVPPGANRNSVAESFRHRSAAVAALSKWRRNGSGTLADDLELSRLMRQRWRLALTAAGACLVGAVTMLAFLVER